MMNEKLIEKVAPILAEVFKDGMLQTGKSGKYEYGDRVSQIVQAIESLIRQEERERIIKWGIGLCPHWADWPTKDVGVIKRDCSLCWQALEATAEKEE